MKKCVFSQKGCAILANGPVLLLPVSIKQTDSPKKTPPLLKSLTHACQNLLDYTRNYSFPTVDMLIHSIFCGMPQTGNLGLQLLYIPVCSLYQSKVVLLRHGRLVPVSQGLHTYYTRSSQIRMILFNTCTSRNQISRNL